MSRAPTTRWRTLRATTAPRCCRRALRHPQDKAKVESAVQVVERWILMRLRHQRFASVDDVNEAIVPLLDELNSKPFQKLPGSRASAFADLDAPALQPLPLQPWEFAVFKTVRVHIDHHVEVDGHRYSVPQALVGQVMEPASRGVVELLHRGQRVAAHCAVPTRAASPPWRAHARGSPPRAPGVDARAADSLGPEHWCGHRAHRGASAGRAAPPRAWLPRLPGLALALKKYGKPRLEAACLIALELGTTKYSHVRDILANKRTRCSPPAPPTGPARNTSMFAAPAITNKHTYSYKNTHDDEHDDRSVAHAQANRHG
jgi:hypothetical protein